MFPKKKRFISEENKRIIRSQPCATGCGKMPPSDPAHIKSKGSGGGDYIWNMVPFCRKHHSDQHQLGWPRMIRDFPILKIELETRGWFLEGDKLRNHLHIS